MAPNLDTIHRLNAQSSHISMFDAHQTRLHSFYVAAGEPLSSYNYNN